MNITPEQRFAITADLLYPAALGAGIAWGVEAFLHWKSHSIPPAAAGWSLFFGAFFIVYHSRSFVTLRNAHSPHSSSPLTYTSSEFAKDLIDCVALGLAFMCLRFPGGNLQLVDPVGTFVVAGLIPAGALITAATIRGPKLVNASWFLRSIALLVAGLGGILSAWQHDPHKPFTPCFFDWLFLVALIVLLGCYIIWPKHFGVERKDKFTDCQTTIRTVFAVIVLVGASYFVLSRVKAEPAEPTSAAERWVRAGIVQNFDLGRPCGAAPAIKDQMPAIVASLQALHPSKVRVLGTADTTPLTPLAREFVGNNAGLARMRANCVRRWLDNSDVLPGVEFIEGVDLPREFHSAEPTDRSVIVFALTQGQDLQRH